MSTRLLPAIVTMTIRLSQSVNMIHSRRHSTFQPQFIITHAHQLPNQLQNVEDATTLSQYWHSSGVPGLNHPIKAIITQPTHQGTYRNTRWLPHKFKMATKTMQIWGKSFNVTIADENFTLVYCITNRNISTVDNRKF